jgi:hypothetical protein
MVPLISKKNIRGSELDLELVILVPKIEFYLSAQSF